MINFEKISDRDTTSELTIQTGDNNGYRKYSIRSGTIIGRVRDETILFAGIPMQNHQWENFGLNLHSHFDLPSTIRSLQIRRSRTQVSGGGMTDSAKVRWSEDCLTLNISVPIAVRDEEEKGKRSVLVWIHGVVIEPVRVRFHGTTARVLRKTTTS